MKIRTQKAFTLIELVMVIVIIGILAVVAIPKFLDMATEAKTAAEKGVVGGVRAGIYTYYAKYNAYPSALGGSGACTTAAPCFGNVLGQGAVSADWSVSGTTYTGPIHAYAYSNSDGSFLQQ